MTIDEAIKHCEEKERELKEEAHSYSDDERYSGAEADCLECANEHKQLAEWLKDYKRLLEERPQGEWEDPFEHNGKMYHKCNHCHISIPLMLIDNYCSYCGAVMRKGGKEE